MTGMKSVILGAMAVLMCLASCQSAYVLGGRTEAETVPSRQAEEETMLSEMMTSEEEAEVDMMFPDRMRDDLKLELILKALVILKTFEGHPIGSISSWLPSYDVMPDELKLKLILKALILLKERPLDAMFAGRIFGELKLTLILKAIHILEESKGSFSFTADPEDLKLALLIKAIDILEVYQGSYEDTVFFTKSKKQLKLALILKAITLLKRGNWPVDIGNFWPMGEEDEPEGSQSETTTQEQTTVAVEMTPEPVTEATDGGNIATKKPWLKKGISKVFKWLKFLPKFIHKKKHHIFN